MNLRIFAKFRENKPSLNGEITLLFTDIGKSCLSHEFLTSQRSFNIIGEYKILAKISEFTEYVHVLWSFKTAFRLANLLIFT